MANDGVTARKTVAPITGSYAPKDARHPPGIDDIDVEHPDAMMSEGTMPVERSVQKEPFPFERLPPELRVVVYRLLLTGEEPLRVSSATFEKSHCYKCEPNACTCKATNVTFKAVHPLLLVSRRIHEEASAIRKQATVVKLFTSNAAIEQIFQTRARRNQAQAEICEALAGDMWAYQSFHITIDILNAKDREKHLHRLRLCLSELHNAKRKRGDQQISLTLGLHMATWHLLGSARVALRQKESLLKTILRFFNDEKNFMSTGGSDLLSSNRIELMAEIKAFAFVSGVMVDV